jgi:hypothetical protein
MLTQIIIGILAGFTVLMLCLLLGAGRGGGGPRPNYRRAMMRLILIGIPIGLAASTGVILLGLFVPRVDEGAFALGPFLGGIAGFLALSIAFWTGLRMENATAP